ncbi:hypothetical protein JKP31_22530, partial [Vibrio vulnificus]|nr:hypothetical protein [Vibrio vulnificus]
MVKIREMEIADYDEVIALWVQTEVHISEHSDQSFRDYPITHFGLNRSL